MFRGYPIGAHERPIASRAFCRNHFERDFAECPAGLASASVAAFCVQRINALGEQRAPLGGLCASFREAHNGGRAEPALALPAGDRIDEHPAAREPAGGFANAQIKIAAVRMTAGVLRVATVRAVSRLACLPMSFALVRALVLSAIFS